MYGLTGRLIEVETDISSNLPAFVLVGLPDASISEAASRVRSATANSKLALPGRRITVNLSPASVPKQGSSFDLAIAVSVMAAAGLVSQARSGKTIYIGELALDGSIRPVNGILAAVISAKALGAKRVVVPLANQPEASLVTGIEIQAYDHLTQVAAELGAHVPAKPSVAIKEVGEQPQESVACFSDVLGQPDAITALQVAAAGSHHVLMYGPPGAGKTMLASRLPTILPNLTEQEMLEVHAIQSVARLELGPPTRTPPFQAPHHTASMVSMIGGGGAQPRPGLISLAHQGVLFLDEAPEFQSNVLEALRQPLESGEITISRASGNAKFPAKFQLVLAANPCPCGHAIGSGKNCICTSSAKAKYISRISGPLSDRLDLRLQLNPVNAKLVAKAEAFRTSKELKTEVEAARLAATERLQKTPWSTNSEVPGSFLRRELRLSRDNTKHLDTALDRGALSMRGYDRCLRVAWSIADLAGHSSPSQEDIAQSIFLRGSEI